jgi:hypothetical protein
MYDIPELEKKWRKYKRNKIKKPIMIGLGVFALVGVISFAGIKYLNSTTNNTTKEVAQSKQNTPLVANSATQKQTQNNSSNSPAIVITKTPVATQQPVVQKSVPQPTAKANANSDDTIDLSNATIVKPNVPDDEIRVIGFDNKEKKEVTDKYKDILTPQTNNKPKIDPKVLAYEERFKETQDPQDSLFLAKYFYKKGDYQKAETWAVNTNNIDGDIEDSWIIFAKSRAKQGHRVDAIKVLQSYYDETGSAKAKDILDKLRRNIPFK